MSESVSVLVLDDEPIVGKRLRTALEKNGHEVEVFEDSRVALARHREQIIAQELEVSLSTARMNHRTMHEQLDQLAERIAPAAERALAQNDRQRFAALARGLEDYPLYPYLQLADLAGRLQSRYRLPTRANPEILLDGEDIAASDQALLAALLAVSPAIAQVPLQLGDEPLPEIPPLDLRYRLVGRLGQGRWQPELSLRHVEEQGRVSSAFGETGTPGFDVVDPADPHAAWEGRAGGLLAAVPPGTRVPGCREIGTITDAPGLRFAT
mgnify:CR=1 FL=1